MCRTTVQFLLTVIVLPLAMLAEAGSGRLADIEIYDRSTGHILPIYRHGGDHYVAGQPGHEYEIRLSSRDRGRLLAITSVDGVNVVTGETAGPQQSGYVLDGFETMAVAGWRKSLSHIAAFHFTALENSYAVRTGRPEDVGVIGVALFREMPRMVIEEAEIAASAPPAAPVVDGAPGAAESRSWSKAPASASGYSTRPQEALGTGHGRSEWSSASYTPFARASSMPEEIVTIYYDSRTNLVARGVIPASVSPLRRPRAFPSGFVPDP